MHALRSKYRLSAKIATPFAIFMEELDLLDAASRGDVRAPLIKCSNRLTQSRISDSAKGKHQNDPGCQQYVSPALWYDCYEHKFKAELLCRQKASEA